MNPERLQWILSGLDYGSLNQKQQDLINRCKKILKTENPISAKLEGQIEKLYRKKSS